MQITIDTARDSPEHIRQAIKMLMSLLGEGHSFSNEQKPANIFDSPGTAVAPGGSGGVFGNIFDEPAPGAQVPSAQPKSNSGEYDPDPADAPPVELY